MIESRPLIATLTISLLVHAVLVLMEVPVPPVQGNRWDHGNQPIEVLRDYDPFAELAPLEPPVEQAPDEPEPELLQEEPEELPPTPELVAAVNPRALAPDPSDPELGEPDPGELDESAGVGDPSAGVGDPSGDPGAAGGTGGTGGSGGGSSMGLPFDLSPLAAARAGANPDFQIGTGPRRNGGGATSMGLGRPDDPTRTPEAIQAGLNARLREATRQTYITRRDPPELRRTRDGGYTWSGPTLSARIRPDGTVAFTDRGSFTYDRDSTFGQQGATFSFDIGDAAERRAGNDPYAAERQWFLDQTEEVRDQLADEHHAQVSRDGLRNIRGDLEGIWSSQASAAQRRRRLFQLWDGFSEDEVGARARRAVVSFVRERLPQASPIAYSDDELRSLNRGRESAARFAPYAGGAAEEEESAEPDAPAEDPAADAPSDESGDEPLGDDGEG